MSQIEDLEEQLKANRVLIQRGAVIKRLVQNPDFKEVIVEYFSTQDCARYVRESVDPALDPEQRASALAFAQAAGYLKQWIMIQLRFAAQAEAQMGEVQEAIDEARAEEAGV